MAENPNPSDPTGPSRQEAQGDSRHHEGSNLAASASDLHAFQYAPSRATKTLGRSP